MKVCFKNVGNSNFSDKIDVLKDFSQYLQSELKLDKEVHIHFRLLKKRWPKMDMVMRSERQ